MTPSLDLIKAFFGRASNGPYSSSIANIVGSFLVTVLSLLSVPLYLQFLGLEAYGLVGFFSALTAWFSLLDAGLLPALSREMSRFRAGEVSASVAAGLFFAVQKVFTFIAVFFGILWAMCVPFWSSNWFQLESLSNKDVVHCLQIMGLVVASRLVLSIYRIVLLGLNEQLLVNVFTVLFLALRIIVTSIFLLIWPTITTFFLSQFLLNCFEVFAFKRKVERLLDYGGEQIDSRIGVVKPFLGLSLATACSSILWVSVSQFDRILLSRWLTLTEFSAYSVSMTIISIIPQLSSAINQAFLPKLVEARNSEKEFAALFLKAAELLTLFVAPFISVIVFFSSALVHVWTGNDKIRPESFLPSYALAHGVLAILSLLYSVQFSKGRLTFHVYANIFYSVSLASMLWFLTKHYGAEGSSKAWMVLVVLYLLIAGPFVFKHFLVQVSFLRTIFKLVVLFFSSAIPAYLVSNWIDIESFGRFQSLLTLIVSWLLCLIFAGLCIIMVDLGGIWGQVRAGIKFRLK